MEQSQKIRRALAGAGGVDEDGDGVVYRTMAAYARDVIITGNGREAAKIKGILGDNSRDRPGREPAAAAEADTGEHALVERRRADAAAAHRPDLPGDQRRAARWSRRRSRPTLVRGVISYPRIDTKPVVAVQTTQKTEAGNTGMDVSMQTATASHVSRWRRPVLAGDQLVDAERARPVVPARRSRLRAEDGAGRGAGAAALRVLEQHRDARWRRRRRSRSS